MNREISEITLPNGEIAEVEHDEGLPENEVKQKLFSKNPKLFDEFPELKEKYPDYAPKKDHGFGENFSKALDYIKGLGEGAVESGKKILNDMPSVTHNLTQDPLRFMSNIVAGMAKGASSPVNIPANLSKSLYESGLSPGYLEQPIPGLENSRMGMGNLRPGEETVQGLASYALPYGAIGKGVQGAKGVFQRALGAGAYGVSQNQDPLAASLMGAAGEGIPKAVTEGANQLRPSVMFRGKLSPQELTERMRAVKGTNMPLGNVIDSPALQNIHAVTSEVPFAGGEGFGKQLQDQLMEKGANAIEGTRPDNFVNDPNYLSDQLVKGIVEPYRESAENLSTNKRAPVDEHARKAQQIEEKNLKAQEDYKNKLDVVEKENVKRQREYELKSQLNEHQNQDNKAKYDAKQKQIDEHNQRKQAEYDVKRGRIEEENSAKQVKYEKELSEHEEIKSSQEDVINKIKAQDFTSEPEDMVHAVVKSMEDPLKTESEAIVKAIEPTDVSADPNEVVKKIVTSSHEEHNKKNQEGYKELDALAEKENLSPNFTKYEAHLEDVSPEILDILSSKLGLNPDNKFGTLSRQKGNIYGEPTFVKTGLKQARLLKSKIYSLANDYLYGDRMSAGIGKQLKSVAMKLDSDIKESIERKGSKELKAAQTNADENYKKNIVPFTDEEVRDIIDKRKSYDTVIDDIIKAGGKDEFSGIKKVMDLLPEENKKLLGFAYLRKAMDKAGNIDPAALHKLINKLGNRQFKELFPDDAFRERLKGFANKKAKTESTKLYKLFKGNKDPDKIITDIIQPNSGSYTEIERFKSLMPEDKQDFLGMAYLKGAVNKLGELDPHEISRRIDALSTKQFNALFSDPELRAQLINLRESRKKAINEPLYKILNPYGGDKLLKRYGGERQAPVYKGNKALPNKPQQFTYERPLNTKTPEKLAHEIINPNKLNKSYDYVDNIKRAQELLPEDQKKLLGHLYLRNALDETGGLNLGKLAHNLDALGEKQFNALFPDKKLAQSLVDFVKSNEISKKSGSKESLKYLAKAFPVIFGAGGGIFGGVPGVAGAAAGGIALSRQINKALTSPVLREKLINKMIENSKKSKVSHPLSNLLPHAITATQQRKKDNDSRR